MATKWNPEDYHDEFRARLSDVIRKRIKQKGKTTKVLDEPEEVQEGAATNVVDFVALLQKSLGKKGETKATSKTTKKPAAKKSSPKRRQAG